tara:strand:- start:656 stop:892 length:237 start_codon:yes stop_codon:yes gene_type:complete
MDCKTCGLPTQPVKALRSQERRIEDLLKDVEGLGTKNRSLKAELASARAQLDKNATHIMQQMMELRGLRRRHRLPAHL